MNRIIEIARTQVGVSESPPDSNCVKYNDWFYGKPTMGRSYPWCATFVSWVYNEAGYPLPNMGYRKGYAGCDTAYNYFKANNEIVDNVVAQPGDIVIFDWNGDGHCDHTGIFLRDLGKGQFEAIEGNTSVGNDSNGGSVMVRVRNYGVVKCIARPTVIKHLPRII